MPLEQPADSRALVAVPAWHTQLLLCLLLVVPVAGICLGSKATPDATSSKLASAYLPLLLVNVGLVAYVARCGLGRSIFWQLVGERPRARSLLVEGAWALGLLAALIAAENLLNSLQVLPESVAAHTLVAASPLEKACWLIVAVAVGFSEELVYRGYLRQRLTTLTNSASFGVCAQAMLFGVAHGEQGSWAVARFALYALGFGWVAYRRGSIWACALCHVALDAYAGLAG
jgi:membrane protease YdiL (CAAX protease family)